MQDDRGDKEDASATKAVWRQAFLDVCWGLLFVQPQSPAVHLARDL